MTRRETRIVNRLGLHARAAAQLVRMANEYNSDISLIKSNQQANAKTIMEVLMLGAAQGKISPLRLEVMMRNMRLKQSFNCSMHASMN